MSDAIVTIDSASFNGTERLEFTPEVGVPFTPYFRSGSINIKNATDVEEKGNLAIPTEFALEQNYPNPFNPSTTIRFGLPETTDIQLMVYDIRGRLVRTLLTGEQSAGWHQVVWNGLDETGTQVATGMYFAWLQGDGVEKSVKMIYMK